ncbi:MAG: glycosyltransferase [Bacteroidota bacterium]
MTVFGCLLIGLCSLYIAIQLFYLLLLYRQRPKQYQALDNYPSISILVAARNEEDNILNCLHHLNYLNYPSDKVEILIGNDLSTDNTKAIIEQYIADKPKFRLINLTGDEHPQTRGKARVLAVLGEQARGEVLLITDADITVNPQWAKGMTEALIGSQSGLVAGITNIKAETMFAKFQQVDWLYFMGIFYAFSGIGKPLSAVGNNMAVLKSAYDATGGYVKIPFSITEDYALFKAVRQKGYTTQQLMSPETLLYSQPIENLNGLIKQRKRWLVGGWDLPLMFRLMIFIFGTWYIALPLLLLTPFIWQGICLLIVKEFIQLFQLLRINSNLKLKPEHPVAILFYDVYLFIIIPITSIAFFLPGNNVWKGRKY